jgi:hypothetical protein
MGVDDPFATTLLRNPYSPRQTCLPSFFYASPRVFAAPWAMYIESSAATVFVFVHIFVFLCCVNI